MRRLEGDLLRLAYVPGREAVEIGRVERATHKKWALPLPNLCALSTGRENAQLCGKARALNEWGGGGNNGGGGRTPLLSTRRWPQPHQTLTTEEKEEEGPDAV